MRWNNILEDTCPKCDCAVIMDAEENRVHCETEYEVRGELATCFVMAMDSYIALKRKIGDRNKLREFDHDNTEELNNL